MRRVLWLSWLLAAGCAPSAPPAAPAAPADPTDAPAAAASASAAPAGEPGAGPQPLPVAAPANLLLAARSRPAMDVARELGKLVGLPVEMVLSMAGPDVVRMDAGLGAVALLEEGGASDAAPGLVAAFSVPVKSEQAFTAMASGDPARWRQRGVGFTVRQGMMEGLFCKTVLSLGDAPVRAVCGPSEGDVTAAAPFLTRGLPQAEMPPGDVRIEVKLGPLKRRYLGALRERQQQASMLSWGGGLLLGGVVDPAVLGAPGAVLDEGVRFADALEGLSGAVTVDGAGRQLEFAGHLRLASSARSSWLVRVMTSRSERGPVPGLFWRLPRSSQVALWGHGIDATLVDEPRQVVRRAAGLLLEKLDVDTADRRAVDEAIAAFPRGDRPWGLGLGSSGEGEAARGWALVGSEVPASVYGTWLRKTGQAVRRAVSAASKAGVPGASGAALARVEESPAGFPAGSTLLELSGDLSGVGGPGGGLGGLASLGALGGTDLGGLDLGGLDLGGLDLGGLGLPNLPGLSGGGGRRGPKRAPAPAPAKKGGAGPAMVMVAVPDGRGESWLAMGADRAVLKARVAEALVRAPREGQVGSLPEAEAHRGDRASFGGVLALGDAVSEATRRTRGSKGGPAVPVWLSGEIEPRSIGVKGRLSSQGISDLAGMMGGVGGLLGR